MKHKLLLLALLFCFSAVSWAQERQVSGTVTVAKDGSALPGVNVVVKGTTQGTATDIDGNYSISAASGDVLVFSFIGYANQEVTVGNQSTINIQMKESVTSLNEIVVVGYGNQKKEDVTGSIATVEPKDFNKGVTTSPQDLLVGRVAGVQVTTNGGAPGSGATVRIRGGSSLAASNDPLYVIDGFPISSSGISGVRNPLSLINPNDIESVSVLKDASATAIYGNRASNGVIIITTKKGTEGTPQVHYSGNVSVGEIPRYVDALSAPEFKSLINKRIANNAPNTPAAAADLIGNANTDWQSQIFRQAVGTEHNVSVSGTYNFLPYRISGNYSNQNGILDKTNMERTTISANLSPKFFDDNLKVNVNFKGAFTNNSFTDEGAIGNAILFDPTQPVMNENTDWGGYFYWPQASDPLHQITIAPSNPVAMIQQTDNHAKVNRYIGNLQLDYTLPMFPELRANLNLGMDRTTTDGLRTVAPNAVFTYDADQGNGIYNPYNAEYRNDLLEYYMEYSKYLESIKSKLSVMAGYSWQHFYNENSHETFDYNQTNVKDTFKLDKAERYLVSFYGRLNYSYDDKYVVTATLRRDGSSRFAKGNRWGIFPSVGLAWKINQESFLAESDLISNLKLRLGYGVTGQEDVGPYYPSQAKVTFSDNKTQYQFGNQFYNTIRFEGYDKNLKWEETTTYNAGLDFGFWNDRLTGSVDYYKRTTDNLLNVIPVPAGTNFTNQILTNVGSLENNGIEVSLDGTIYNTKDFYWDLGVNLTHNENKITKLLAVQNPDYLGNLVGGISGAVGNTVQVQQVGQPANAFFLYQQVYDNNGNPVEGLYVDQNQDGIINDQDRIVFHKPTPDVYMGFSSSVNYKKFSFSFNARMNLRNYVYNNVESYIGHYANLYNSTGYLNNLPQNIHNTDFNSPQYLSSYYIQDASFFRMDNMTLGYDFGNVWNDHLGIRANVTLQNAFVITKYDGLDPEVDGGIDNNFYPRPRTVIVGVNMNIK